MTNSIHAIRLGRSKVFAVWGERTILVDCGMPGDEARIVAACARSTPIPSRSR